MYYCLIENDLWGDGAKCMRQIILISKSKEELQELKLLLEKKFSDRDFEIVEL